MCDITPDISHTDQMALIVKYVTIQNGIAQVKESFLNFFPLRGKTAAEISRSILDELEVNNLDVMMCRGKVTTTPPLCQEFILEFSKQSKT